MCCEDCFWHHAGMPNNCWLEHHQSEECGDYEPMNEEITDLSETMNGFQNR